MSLGGRQAEVPSAAQPAGSPGTPQRAFTGEQWRAVADRTGSRLLSANAGSGKTAVMVERFVEAVLSDGVGVSEVLALTFTEKAAGELRERVRRRFAELGEEDHARAVDGSWVGTIHRFCARVLRAESLAAGLDPRFQVLDEPAAGRLVSETFGQALEEWSQARGEAALALAGAYGTGLQALVTEAHAALRSSGQTRPVLPRPAPVPAPDQSALRAAHARAATVLGGAPEGPRVVAALAALAACERLLGAGPGAGSVPDPAGLSAGRLASGNGILADGACDEYRSAWEAYRQACADHHARAAVALLDDLLQRFGGAYAAAKARRGGVDFADLELCARDLLTADGEVRERWSRRFALLMVDEFQDTNRVQLHLLEALERDNLFAVGDELQSIYGFRHADVKIFRERRAALGKQRLRRLTANFRSREDLLDVLNAAFSPVFGSALTPLRAGRRAPAQPAEGLPGSAGCPVELLVTDCRDWQGRERELGLVGLAEQVWRRAEARLLAERLHLELAGGRRPADVVVLVRATSSLRLFEQALEERGIPTYVLGGRGYWSHEQVRDGLSYLSALANPLDESALLATLASPFCGVGSDALVLLARAGRQSGAGLWGALRRAHRDGVLTSLSPEARARLRRFVDFFSSERAHAERSSPEALLERAITVLGYDVAILERAGGDRRMANLRKLLRLARAYDRSEGRDLRGFVTFAGEQDLREAREGDAPLEAEDLDAVRLMTIHRAKGLEFPVVAVADLGRRGSTARPALLTSSDGRVGLRLATLGGGERVDALDYRALAVEHDRAQQDEERRLLYVATTRAEEKLILSGGADGARVDAARPGGAPFGWLLPALLGDARAALDEPGSRSAAGVRLERGWDGRSAGVRLLVNTADGEALAGFTAAAGDAASRRPVETGASTGPSGGPARAVPLGIAQRAPARSAVPATSARLSYTALASYARCPYRYYLQRILGLPSVPSGHAGPGEQLRLVGEAPAVDGRVRGVVVHRLLERLDFGRPRPPAAEQVRELLTEEGVPGVAESDVADITRLVDAFGRSPLCARVARATRVQREAPFAFTPRPGGEPLITGVLDVHAQEADGTVLIVDYKTDRLGDQRPSDVVRRDYAMQRAIYALAALAGGTSRVEVSYCFLERPAEPVSDIFTPHRAALLAEQVTGASDGVLEQRWPVAEQPHRQMCGDCPGRRSLCSHPQNLTMREPGETQVGALVRSKSAATST